MYKVEIFDGYQKVKFRAFGITFGTIERKNWRWSTSINLKSYTKHFKVTQYVDLVGSVVDNQVSLVISAFGMEYPLLTAEIVPNGSITKEFEVDVWNKHRVYVSGKIKISVI